MEDFILCQQQVKMVWTVWESLRMLKAELDQERGCCSVLAVRHALPSTDSAKSNSRAHTQVVRGTDRRDCQTRACAPKDIG
jgi:hypothetical protein